MKKLGYMKNMPYTSKNTNIQTHVFTENEMNVFILGEISPSSAFDGVINLLTNSMHIIPNIPAENGLVETDDLNDVIPLLTLSICLIL